MRTTVGLFFAITFSCLTVGCGPAPQPVWNADSNSFFFTSTDGSVQQHDLNKKASRVLWAPGPQKPYLVAVNAKVPFLALGQSALGAEGRAVQLGLASLVNHKVTWSPLEIWGDPQAQRAVSATCCYWCPSGQRVLIWYQEESAIPGFTETKFPYGKFAVFDVRSQSLSELTTTEPATILCQMLHVSPIAPDGSGYLAMKLLDKGPQFFFVGWDGWEYPLSTDAEVDAFLNLLGDKNAASKPESKSWFFLPQGVWTKDVLRFATRRGTVAVDLKERRIVMEPLEQKQQREFEQISAADAADSPVATIQVVRFQGGQFALHCRQKNAGRANSARIDLVDNKLGRRRVLLEGVLPTNFTVHHLFPSPDGQLILACLIEASSNTSQIHVVRADGNVLASVDTGLVQTGGETQ
ncbi:MAG: hypothetical protein U0929_01625 [Planctomycetaceae bacterium]